MSPLRKRLIWLPVRHPVSSLTGGKPSFLSMFIPKLKHGVTLLISILYGKTITPPFRSGIIERTNKLGVLTPFRIGLYY